LSVGNSEGTIFSDNNIFNRGLVHELGAASLFVLKSSANRLFRGVLGSVGRSIV
jgi:hypothetical protein